MTIIKRGPYQFQAQVRKKGYPTQIKTFESKAAAEAWRAVILSEMARGVFADRSELERTTLDDLLVRYSTEITPSKKSWQSEQNRVKQLRKHPLAKRSLASLRSVDFSTYRDQQLARGLSGSTVRLELALLSSVFKSARQDWSLNVDNPITHVRKPKPARARERRLSTEEEARLREVAGTRSSLMLCIELAIETGMRAGEIVALEWKRIDLKNSIVILGDTKNGDSRVVPLSAAAEETLRALPRPIGGGKVVSHYDSAGISNAFQRACRRAGIQGLRFHDLRHEAASRLAPHMPVQTLAKVMGWRSLSMAMRYYNPSASELVAAVRAAAG